MADRSNAPTGYDNATYSVSQEAAASARRENTFLDAQWRLGEIVFHKGTCADLGDTPQPPDLRCIVKKLVASVDREQRNQGQDTSSSYTYYTRSTQFSGFPGAALHPAYALVTVKCGCSSGKSTARRARGEAAVAAGRAPDTLNECMAGAEPLGGLSLQQRSKINGSTTVRGASFASATVGRFDTKSVSAWFNKASGSGRPSALKSTVEFLKVCTPAPNPAPNILTSRFNILGQA